MNTAYLLLAGAALLPVLFSVFFYILEKKTNFKNWNYLLKQLLYGVVFGGLAILGTEAGIPVKDGTLTAQTNCRDGAVLVAGLFFGAPAGIIAGLIGGIERWFAVYWGIGTFTRVACSVSTIIAGFYSAVLRKFMFEDKKPSWFISFAIGIVMEVFHLTMVFLTNMSTPESAMAIVKICTAPMLISNAASVFLTSLLLSVLYREPHAILKKKTKTRISQTIQRWLLVTVVLAFSATSYFVYALQDTLAQKQADSLLDMALREVEADILDATNSSEPILPQIKDITKNRHVGETGFITIFDEDDNLISGPEGYAEKMDSIEFETVEDPVSDTTFLIHSGNETFYCRYKIASDYYIISILPEAEALKMRNIALYVNAFMEILVFAVLFALIYLLIKKVVVNQITNINHSLSKITEGDLGVVVNVRSNEEFASLSDDINSTVDTLKKYISEAEARIDKELEFAKNIQSSALPNVFPAFPKRKDFDIFASMNPAKEVGGDFYDFYITHEDTLHFLIADVSGKGIPAAMFMMRAKTELKTLTESDVPIGEVFTHGNAALCEGNDAGMFVTAWQGSLDLTTGLVSYANAGHNPPLVKHKDGQFAFLKSPAGFVLAGMDGVNYKERQFQLDPGDEVYLYTDGVTEATNAQNELYGEERLLAIVNSKEFSSMQELCSAVKADIDKFVGEAPQFDDITMVGLKYIGTPPAPTLHFENTTLADIPKITEFVETALEKAECPMKTVIQINVAIDEICSNIIKYGYKDKTGPLTVSLHVKDDPRSVSVRFIDDGVPYNPLTKADPDVTLSADKRQIGGLGIFMVKKTMDDVRYKYEQGQNILTIRKFF